MRWTLPVGARSVAPRAIGFCLILGIGPVIASPRADAAQRGKPRTVMAMVIEVEGEAGRVVAPEAAGDPDLVARTLRTRLTIPEKAVSVLAGAHGATAPTRDSLSKEIPRFLDGAFPRDLRIIYYRGRVLRDAAGRAYLAAAGTDPARPAETALAAETLASWLKSCPAPVLFVADADGAGELVASGPNLEYLGAPASGVTSGSLTRWFCRGIEGAADADGDGAVTLDELGGFVERTSRRTGEALVRRPASPEFQSTLDLRPIAADAGYRHIAAAIDEHARLDRATRVVPEHFRSDSGAFHSFASVGPEEVGRVLVERAGGAYEVDRLAQPAAAGRGAGGASHRLRATYTVDKSNKLMHLRYSLVRASGDRAEIARGTQVLLLDANLAALVDQATQPTPAALAANRAVRFPIEIRTADGSLPLDDPKGDGVRILEVPDGAATYKIVVENPTKERVLLRLLIDGVNTIVQAPGETEFSAVPLERARGYLLEPGERFTFDHWRRNEGEGAENPRFEFAPPKDSVAARLREPGAIGTILLAFYREKKAPTAKGLGPDLGTREGKPVVHNLRIVPPVAVEPDPIGVETIRYRRTARIAASPAH